MTAIGGRNILWNIQLASSSSRRRKGRPRGVPSSSIAVLLFYSSSQRRRPICCIIWSPKNNLRGISQFSNKHTKAHSIILPRPHCGSIRSNSPTLESPQQYQCCLVNLGGTVFLTASCKFTPLVIMRVDIISNRIKMLHSVSFLFNLPRDSPF